MAHIKRDDDNFKKFLHEDNPSWELANEAEKDVLKDFIRMGYFEYLAQKTHKEKEYLDELLQDVKDCVKEIKESPVVTNECLSSFERYYDMFNVLLDCKKGYIKNYKEQAALMIESVTLMQKAILPAEVYNQSEAYAENPIGMAIRLSDLDLIREAVANSGEELAKHLDSPEDEESTLVEILKAAVDMRDAVNKALSICYGRNDDDGIRPDILPDGSYAINGEVIYESKTSLDYDMSFLDEIGLTPENYDEWIQKHAPEGYITHKEFKASLDDVLNNNDIDLAAKALVPKKKGLFGKLFRR